jgi:uncharacterized membrane protein YkoI
MKQSLKIAAVMAILVTLLAAVLVGSLVNATFAHPVSEYSAGANEPTEVSEAPKAPEADEANEPTEAPEVGEAPKAPEADEANEPTEAPEADDRTVPAQSVTITPAQAQSNVLAANPGATVVETKIDDEDGAAIYKITLNTGVKVKVDVRRGTIISTTPAEDDD